jgi:hypothetical protein
MQAAEDGRMQTADANRFACGRMKRQDASPCQVMLRPSMRVSKRNEQRTHSATGRRRGGEQAVTT